MPVPSPASSAPNTGGTSHETSLSTQVYVDLDHKIQKAKVTSGIWMANLFLTIFSHQAALSVFADELRLFIKYVSHIAVSDEELRMLIKYLSYIAVCDEELRLFIKYVSHIAVSDEELRMFIKYLSHIAVSDDDI